MGSCSMPLDKPLCVRLDAGVLASLDNVGAGTGLSRMTLIRRAVDEFIARETGAEAKFNRMAMLAEFSQLALDTLIREQVPDKHRELVLTVKQRMESHHAPR